MHSAAAASLAGRFTTLLKLFTAQCTLLRHWLLAEDGWTAAAFGPRRCAFRLSRSVHSPAQSQNNRQPPRQSLPLAQGQRPARERGRCDSAGGEVSTFRASSPCSELLGISTGLKPRGTGPRGEVSAFRAFSPHSGLLRVSTGLKHRGTGRWGMGLCLPRI